MRRGFRAPSADEGLSTVSAMRFMYLPAQWGGTLIHGTRDTVVSSLSGETYVTADGNSTMTPLPGNPSGKVHQ